MPAGFKPVWHFFYAYKLEYLEFKLKLGGFEVGYQKTPSRRAVGVDGIIEPGMVDRFNNTYTDYDFDFTSIREVVWGAHSDTNMIELFHSIPEIFAAVDAIASRVADATWLNNKDYREDANAAIDYKDEDFNRLFSQPHPLFIIRNLIYQAVCYEICTGKQYFFANRPDSLVNWDYRDVSTICNLPADIIRVLHPQRIKLFTATEIKDVITGYYLDKDNIFPPEKVLAINAPNLNWGDRYLKGKSMLLSAHKAICNLIAVYEARNLIYTKRGPLGVMVSKKEDQTGRKPLTPNEKDQLNKDLYGEHGVTRGKEIIRSTSIPTEFVKVSADIKDLMPFDETRADAEAIFAALRVPREFLPGNKGSTYENQIQAERGFYNSVIIPWAQRYAQGLTKFLRFDRNRRYITADYSHIDALQENKKEKAEVDKTNGEVYLQRFLNGICTLNDWIISTGNDKMKLPIYQKKLFEMTPEELEQVQAILKLKAPDVQEEKATQTDNKVKPIKNVAA